VRRGKASEKAQEHTCPPADPPAHTPGYHPILPRQDFNYRGRTKELLSGFTSLDGYRPLRVSLDLRGAANRRRAPLV
jgi:hypothetical protein